MLRRLDIGIIAVILFLTFPNNNPLIDVDLLDLLLNISIVIITICPARPLSLPRSLSRLSINARDTANYLRRHAPLRRWRMCEIHVSIVFFDLLSTSSARRRGHHCFVWCCQTLLRHRTCGIFVDQRVWQHVKVGRAPAGNWHGTYGWVSGFWGKPRKSWWRGDLISFPTSRFIALRDIEREDGRNNAMALGVSFLWKGAMLMIVSRLCNLEWRGCRTVVLQLFGAVPFRNISPSSWTEIDDMQDQIALTRQKAITLAQRPSKMYSI